MVHIIDLHFQGIKNTIAAFLIESKAGPVLVETGPHSAINHLQRGIKNLGFQIKDVKHVFLSHIHLDHAGSAWVFAELGATIYVHPFGKIHLVDPSRLMSSAKRIYQEQMDSLWGQMQAIPEDRIITPKDREIIKIGEHAFRAFYTPGHAIHHIAWQLDDVLFAGDLAGVKIGEENMVVPPCPPPDINIEEWRASIELVRQLPLKAIYLTHFGKTEDVDHHWRQIDAILVDWANWIRPYFEKGLSNEEIIPKFQSYTEKQLIDNGISKNGRLQYEAANPSWMSVAGLVRYWKKKLAR